MTFRIFTDPTNSGLSERLVFLRADEFDDEQQAIDILTDEGWTVERADIVDDMILVS